MTNIELEVAHSTNRKNRAVAEYFESQNEKTDSIDWEQRRYEIAKDIYPIVCHDMNPSETKDAPAKAAVELADALIEELKKERKSDELK